MTTESKLAEALARVGEIKARTEGRVYVHRYVTDDADVARVFSTDIPLLVAALEEAGRSRQSHIDLGRVLYGLGPNDCGPELADSTLLDQAVTLRRGFDKFVETADRAAQAIARAEAAEGERAALTKQLNDCIRRGELASFASAERVAQSEAEVARLRDYETIVNALKCRRCDAGFEPDETVRCGDCGWTGYLLYDHPGAAKAFRRLSAARPKGDDDGGE